MRLDHLLSREKAEAERQTPKPRSIRTGAIRIVTKASKKRKRNVNERSKRKFAKILKRGSLCIVFRVCLKRTLTTAQQRKIQERPVLGKNNFTEQLVSGSESTKNQATKSTGWMPWHHTPKKDVASCEKLRGAASRHRSVDIRMGEPGR